MKHRDHNAVRRDTLPRYRSFTPTPMDGHLKVAQSSIVNDVRTLEAWCIAPCSRTRDSDTLARVNWGAMLGMLRAVDPHGWHHETFQFNHWGPGWFEICLVRPRSSAWRVACNIALRLEDYASLDDDELSRVEWQEAVGAFQSSDLTDALVFANETSTRWLKEHADIDMALELERRGIVTAEMLNGGFSWCLLTDHRDETRVREAEAEMLWVARSIVRGES